MVNRRNRAFDDSDIQKIAGRITNGSGRRQLSGHQGFCKSATLAEIEKHNFVLTPGRLCGDSR
jgi:type I restriction enzyme M protein